MTGRLLPACVALASLSGAACTVFDGLEPAAGGAPGAGGGGQGGAFESCVTRSPACVLPELEAARLCARLADCSGLAAGIALSTGLPLVELGEDGSRLAFNFSTCIDWLTGPVEGGHLGFQGVAAAMNCATATSDCASAAACFAMTRLEPLDPRCEGLSGAQCDGQALLDCDRREVTACDHPAFGIASECAASATPTCRVGPCSAPSSSCDVDGAGVEYALECSAAGDQLVASCTAHGLVCSAGAGCTDEAGVATTCDVPYAQRCRGTAVATCTARVGASQLEALVDCGAVGLECVEEGQTARCASPQAQCSPYDAGINVCDGGAIALCLGGARVELECAELGMICVNGAADGTSGRCAWQ